MAERLFRVNVHMNSQQVAFMDVTGVSHEHCGK